MEVVKIWETRSWKSNHLMAPLRGFCGWLNCTYAGGIWPTFITCLTWTIFGHYLTTKKQKQKIHEKNKQDYFFVPFNLKIFRRTFSRCRAMDEIKIITFSPYLMLLYSISKNKKKNKQQIRKQFIWTDRRYSTVKYLLFLIYISRRMKIKRLWQAINKTFCLKL